MSEYLILGDERAARDLSQRMAAHYGCGPVTTAWFAWRVHPSDGRAALRVVSDAEDAVHSKGRQRLSDAERDALVRELPAEWTPEDEDRTR